MSNPYFFENIREMIKNLPDGARLLGLDVGTKTIGLAISDSNFKVAMAIDTIRRTKFTTDIKYLGKIIEDRSIGGLIIGLPMSMDGTEGSACQSIRQFGSNVIDHIQIGITFWDERLSTIAVQRFLTSEADMTRKRRAKVVDKLAATYILQGAIDSL